MLETILLVGAGAFVGWNLPQPFWAKLIQARIEAWWAKLRK